jgi:serine protease Do
MKAWPLLLVSLCLLVGAVVPAQASDEILAALEARVKRAAKENGPSVVCIHVSRSAAYHKAPWGRAANLDYAGDLGAFDADAARKKVAEHPQRERLVRDIGDHDLSDAKVVPESFGSGLVVDASGLILTNYHVVKGATKLYVRVPGKGGSWANIHAGDPRSDLAVLKLIDPPAGLKALEFGDGGAVREGQMVLSLCNAYAPGLRGGDGPEVSSGQVVALRQTPPGAKLDESELHKPTLHHYGTLLQVDAKLVPGCSGGVLLDLEGKAIGLTSALVAVTGDRPGGFAIPLDNGAKRIIEVLKRGEEVEYGFLGVVLQPQEIRGMRENGVRLFRVAPGSPAGRAGFTGGDVIISVDGKPVRNQSDLLLHVGMGLAGNTVKVEARRGLRVVSNSVKLGKFYYPGPILAARRAPARFGLRVDHASILNQRNPFPAARLLPEGVVIREVVPGSPADAALLQPDKLITHVNGRQVTTPAEYNAALAKMGRSVTLTIVNPEGQADEITLNEKNEK